MAQQHDYKIGITWTGNTGTGTSAYAAYERSYTVTAAGKQDMLCSADTPFRGDATKHNPETMLLMALSSCHMLWYLHLCADAGIIVTDYKDEATGTLVLPAHASGHFKEVTLHPAVTVAEKWMVAKANELHKEAGKKCFISNSVNFPVHHVSTCVAG